jgi:hypothetical protein
MIGEFIFEITVLLLLTLVLVPIGFAIKKSENGPYEKGLFFAGITFFLKESNPVSISKKKTKTVTKKETDPAKDIAGNVRRTQYRKWLNGPLFWAVLNLMFKMIRRCYLSVTIKINHAVLIYGFQDPFKTGKACAAISILTPQLPKHFKLIPNFVASGFDLRGDVIFKTRLLSFLILIAEVLINIPYKMIYHIYRKPV